MTEWRQAECRRCHVEMRLRLIGIDRDGAGYWGRYQCSEGHIKPIPLTAQEYERLAQMVMNMEAR